MNALQEARRTIIEGYLKKLQESLPRVIPYVIENTVKLVIPTTDFLYDKQVNADYYRIIRFFMYCLMLFAVMTRIEFLSNKKILSLCLHLQHVCFPFPLSLCGRIMRYLDI